MTGRSSRPPGHLPDRGLRVHLVDPPAYTPPYDHALARALARAGAKVELFTSAFGYGAVPREDGYAVREAFYRWAPGVAGSRVRRATRLAQHIPDMLRYARAAQEAEVVHFQWLAAQPLDVRLLPRGRPRVLTAHDVLPREPRRGQRDAQKRLYERMDAVVVHSEHGAARLCHEAGLDRARIHVIPHGILTSGSPPGTDPSLPAELSGPTGPVVLCFGLLRAYKGIDVLLDAWGRIRPPVGAELWIVGMPRMDVAPLRSAAPAGVRWVPRFVTGAELAAVFARADLAVLPYREIDQSGVLFTALGFGLPLILSAVGGFPELASTGAAELVAPGDPDALAGALTSLLGDPARRDDMARAARLAGSLEGPYGWEGIARRHLELYDALLGRRT